MPSFSIEEVNYLTANDMTRRNPFNLSNDFVEYFYYPVSPTNSTNYFFEITKENQTISAATWNTYSTTGQNVSVQAQVPKLTITTWSGKLPSFVEQNPMNELCCKVWHYNAIS